MSKPRRTRKPKPSPSNLRPGDAERGIVARVEKVDERWGHYFELTHENGYVSRANGDAGFAEALMREEEEEEERAKAAAAAKGDEPPPKG